MGAHPHARHLLVSACRGRFGSNGARASWSRDLTDASASPRPSEGGVDGSPASRGIRSGVLRRRVREVPVDRIAGLDPRDLLVVLRREKEES